jgi:outer membrane receptor for ferric coprogen and ferric-rhodotorulic acid
MVRGTKNLWVGVAFAALAAASSPTVAAAQGAGQDSRLAVSIPAQRLSDALRQLAEASHLQLIYDTKITDGKTSPGVSGAMTSRAALAQLLAGSGLSFKFSGDRTLTIAAAAIPGVRAVGVVNVEGADIPNGDMVSPINGINGSTDVEATEGTGSYTTGAMSIVSKTPQSIRETPQSVSVITSQRIADQGLLNIENVLDAMPGVTVADGSISTEFKIYSRGFQVVSFAFDGGAPISYGLGNRPVLDLSEFDSAQLIRGADGLFGGYGDPGGFVNLERKKPLDHDQFEYLQDIGSWSNFREQADATGPLTADGKLKGRVAAAEQDQDFFYKVANSHKSSIYGVLEYDLTPNAIFTVGANYVREHNITNGGGLPRYSNGTNIDWPVSTCLCEPYDYDNANRAELFANLKYKFNENLSTQLNFTYNHQSASQLYWGLQSTIAPGATPANSTATNGKATATLLGYATVDPNTSYSVDDATTAKFKIFGLEQQFVLGGNYVYYDLDGGSTTYPSTRYTIPDVFQFNPSLYPQPAYQPPTYTTPLNRESIYGIYGNAKLEIIKNFHLMLGARQSGYGDKQSGTSYGAPFVTPSLKDTSHSSLDFGATYDVFKNFTVYASHESIYQPQSETRYTVGGSLPPPITGVNDEAGLKWQSPNKLLNASLSVFQIEEKGIETTNYAAIYGHTRYR